MRFAEIRGSLFMRQWLTFGRRFSVATVSLFALAASANQSAMAGNAKIFDELRFGASGSIEDGHNHEKGVFPEFQLLFNPFGYDPAGDWKEQLTHPRIHLGTSIGTAGSASQLYSGLTWAMAYLSKIFTQEG